MHYGATTALQERTQAEAEVSGSKTFDRTILRAIGRLGPRLLAEAAWSVLLGRRRSLARDAARVLARMDRPLRVEGSCLIPPLDPFVLVANHFQTRDLWIGWVAAALTATVASARRQGRHELHWMVISEWRWFEVGRVWVPDPVSALLFRRACRTWGLIPTPPRPTDVAGRARALRELLACLGKRTGRDTGRGEPVGLFPEGRATVAMEEAKPGTGAFLHRVSRLGVPLVPAGVYQEGPVLVVRFGEPFLIGDPPPTEQKNLDGWARDRVMVAIGRLLPRELWGAYAAAIDADPAS